MKNIKIELTTLQTVQGESEKTHFCYNGQYEFKNGSHYIKYCETTDGVKINTIIKATDNRIVITRSGGAKSRMVIETGVTTQTDYQTPYGVFQLFVVGKMVENNLENGSLMCEYALTTTQGEISKNNIRILIKEV